MRWRTRRVLTWLQTLVRPGLKKIPLVHRLPFCHNKGGERWFWCISPDHEKDLEVWPRLLEFDLDV